MSRYGLVEILPTIPTGSASMLLPIVALISIQTYPFVVYMEDTCNFLLFNNSLAMQPARSVDVYM